MHMPVCLQSTHLMTGSASLDTQGLHRKDVHVETHEPGVLYMPLITALWRLQQKDLLKVEVSWGYKELLTNMGYAVSSGPAWAMEQARDQLGYGASSRSEWDMAGVRFLSHVLVNK